MKVHKLGVIGAMQVEIDGLRARMQVEREETVSGVRFTVGSLHGVELVVCVCGVGKVFAAIAAQALLLRFGVDAIVNTGVAGGLAGDLRVGDVIVAGSVVQHDMNTTALGDPQGLLSGLDLVELPTDETLRAALLRAARGEECLVREGLIASGDLFVAEARDKESIRRHFHADACEMEGAAIGQVAYVNRVPFAILRCISDGGDGMEYSQFVTLAAERSIRVMSRFLVELSG